VTEPTGQFVTVGAQDVIVKTDVVKTVEMVDPVGMVVIDADSVDVIETDPETVEVGATSEVETTEDEAVPLG
jgi:hypothetical protein